MKVRFISLGTLLLRLVLAVEALSLCLLSLPILSATLDDFVITIKSDNTGNSTDVQFTLPTTGTGYNYNIDCDNDGTDEATAQTADYTCDYTSLGGVGTYTVRVEDNSGASTGFPRIYFNNGGDKDKLLTVQQWGTGKWTSMDSAFYGAVNLTFPATDTPDFSVTTSMTSMLNSASLANPNTSAWNTSAVTNLKWMFHGATSATPSVSSWDTSAVINMYGMFHGATSANPDTSSWDTSSVTTMRSMFSGATAANPNTSSWNTSAVANMKTMFLDATSANPDTSSWDTSAVINMRSMFNGATSADPDVSSWDTSAVTTVYAMFFAATSANPDVSSWDTSSVTTMRSIFSGATSANPDVNGWNITAVWDMSFMFLGATSANPDVSNWNVANVTTMDSMFFNATSANPSVSSWDTSSVIIMDDMFHGATSANPDVSSWNVSSVTSMGNMFSGVTLTTTNYDALLIGWNAQSLQSGVSFDGGNSKYCNGESQRSNMIASDSWTITDGGKSCPDMHFVTTWKTDNSGSSNSTSITIPTSGIGYSYDVDWDNDGEFDELGLVGAVTHDFSSAGTYTIRIRGSFPRIYFNNVDDKAKVLSVDQWGSGVWMSMQDAFYGASNLTVPASDAPVLTNVTSLRAMFRGATSMNQSIGHWNTSNITNTLDMFNGANAFNQDISSWDTSKIFTMQAMFNNAIAFNQNISTWDTGATTSMLSMFQGATSFNQPIGSWDTAKVTNMSFMFDDATSFNRDISTWDTNKVTVMVAILRDATSFDQNLASWEVAAVTSMNLMFSGVTLSKGNYDALLTGFDAQVLQSGVLFSGGNSQYCSGRTARANMVASDSWVITDGGQYCTPVAPSIIPDLRLSSDTGSVTTDNITSDNTPSFDVVCSNIGNTITLYSDNPATDSSIATQVCTATGVENLNASVLADGDHNISYTDTLSGDESTHSPSLLVQVDTSSPPTPMCTSSPNPAQNTTSITTTCSAVETGSIVTVTNMNCLPAPVTASNTVSCSGTVGSGGGNISISNDVVSVTDLAGNSDTGETTGLVVDNIAPSLSEASAVTTPAMDSTPSYSFSSSEAGSISYSGSCSSVSSVTVSGTNTVTFNSLSDGSYSDCKITVTDTAGNLSNLLSVSTFEIDSAGPTLTEITVVATPAADNSPSYRFSSTEAGNIAYSGSCNSPTSVAVSGTNTITFNTLSDGSYSDCKIRVTDAAGNLSNLLSVSAFEIDSAGPTLTETTAVVTPAADNSPSYRFGSTEAGNIAYSGSCNSPTSVAVSGTNTITFNALSDGSYSDCKITVADAAGNLSNLLSISVFEIDSAGPTLTETTAVVTPAADNTPSYRFSSSEAGSISYSGSCSSASSVAASGTNTVTFNALSDGSYSDCKITVADAAGNLSNLLSISVFEIDSTGSTLTETTAVVTPAADNTPSYRFSSSEAGSINYTGSCNSTTSAAISGTNGIVFNVLNEGSYSDCQIRVTDAAGNLSNLLTVSPFEIDTGGPTLTETSAVSTPAMDTTPSYSFSSSEAGSISYTGSCSSVTSMAVSGTNVITFNELENGSYSHCRISVKDAAGNVSEPLNVSAFVVDTLLLSLDTQVSGTVLQDEHLLIMQSRIGGKAPFIYWTENLPEWLDLDISTGQIDGTPTNQDVGEYSGIIFHVSDSEERVAKSAVFELRVIDINDAPIATHDIFTLIEGETGVIDVLVNDTDPDDGDIITIEEVSAVLGEVNILDDKLEYLAPIDFVGKDLISYRIVDTGGLTTKAKVEVSITYNPELGLPPSLLVPADVEVNATGLLTQVSLGFATAMDSLNNPISVSKSSGSFFQPGEHHVIWMAEDARGRKSSQSQKVWVHPLISIESDTQVQEGEGVSLAVYLNGDSPIYPLDINYLLSGNTDEDDHDLVSESIRLEKGQLANIHFTTFDDGIMEGDETLTIQLSDKVNLGGKFTHSLTITEQPSEPSIRLKPFQAGIETYTVLDTEGLVTVYLLIDTGSVSGFTYTWQASEGVVNLSNEQSQFVFDPTQVSSGNQMVSLELNSPTGLSVVTRVNIYVTTNTIDLANSQNCSVIHEQKNDGVFFLVETEPQACIMRGELALQSRSGGTQILDDELMLPLDSGQTFQGGVFDFIVFGKPAASTYHIVFPQRKPIPDEAVYIKYSAQLGRWSDFVISAENYLSSHLSNQGRCPEPNDHGWVKGLITGHWCLRLTINDGGPNDDDGLANGMIVDPGGLTAPFSGNHDPIARDDLIRLIGVEEGGLDVLGNDSDSDGDHLVVIEAVADIGSVSIIDGYLWYHSVSKEFVGHDFVSYIISDGSGGFAKAKADVVVTSGNSLPIAVNDQLTMLMNSQIIIDVLNNDSDPDGDLLSIDEASAGLGKVEVSEKRLTYTPNRDFIGEVNITYFILDSSGAMAMAEVKVTVMEGQQVKVKNSSGGVMYLLTFLLLYCFIWRIYRDRRWV
ncbi:BspA family leucine-rich repeat surface protein [Shewanella sp. E94]|uniref:BspA family leucine-rich repeat surface protein n=1 Tax=Shewanella sp. E94 TaxID=2746933 RepID=UPI002DD6845F|nr:BspA family leucine-rich repeat surface protein [Shewanella sp. E94]MEC4738505.1 BspA family leucine-rich repeat surface protein [Shewanella sp. E94]